MVVDGDEINKGMRPVRRGLKVGHVNHAIDRGAEPCKFGKWGGHEKQELGGNRFLIQRGGELS